MQPPLRSIGRRALIPLALGLALLASGANAQGASDAARARQIVENGSALGREAACSSCHGSTGQGQAETGFPRLRGLSVRYLFKQLNDYASEARPNEIMTPLAKRLSEADRQALAEYYGRLQARPIAQTEPAAAEDTRLGQTIYAQGLQERGLQACSNCHGPNGIGLDPTYPRLAGQHALYTATQLRLWRDDVRKNDPSRVMHEIASRMGDREIEAVAAYLASLGR